MEQTRKTGLNPLGEPYGVMIVDDSQFIINQLERILEGDGYKVITSALNGIEAVEKYNRTTKRKNSKINRIRCWTFPEWVSGITYRKRYPGTHGR